VLDWWEFGNGGKFIWLWHRPVLDWWASA